MQSYDSQLELLADMKTQMEKLEMSLKHSRVEPCEVEDSSDDDEIAPSDNEDEYSDTLDNDVLSEYSVSSSISEGLAELLGDENIPLDEDESESEVTDSFTDPSDYQQKSYADRYVPSRCQPIGDSPAIKLTFDLDITIGQFKAIQDKLNKHVNGLIKAEVINDSQLNFHYSEIEEAWNALKWIHDGGKGSSLRDMIPGIKPLTAQYSPGPLWVSDYDGCFSIKVQIKNIGKIEHFHILSQMARFGRIQGLLMDEKKDFVLVRYDEQIDAENALVIIDRAYVLGCWCRAIKAQPITDITSKDNRELTKIDIEQFRHEKITRADVIITSVSSAPLPRDNWKKLLNFSSEYGDVSIIYGDSTGVTVGYTNMGSAHNCCELIGQKKVMGKTITATKHFEIDELG